MPHEKLKYTEELKYTVLFVPHWHRFTVPPFARVRSEQTTCPRERAHYPTASPPSQPPQTPHGARWPSSGRRECSAALAVSLPILRVALALLVLIATEARLLVLILLRLLPTVQVERLVHSMLCIDAGRDAV